MTRYTRHIGSDTHSIALAHAVRRRVFVEQQGVDEAIEMDGRDAGATHVVLTDDGDPIATARLRFPDPSTAKIERVAVLPEYRSEGFGIEVMVFAESAARDAGATAATLHAQASVRGFYANLGYEAVGEQFEEAGIPHVEMRRRLE